MASDLLDPIHGSLNFHLISLWLEYLIQKILFKYCKVKAASFIDSAVEMRIGNKILVLNYFHGYQKPRPSHFVDKHKIFVVGVGTLGA